MNTGVIYEWGGLNALLFAFFNQLHTEAQAPFLRFISDIGEHHNFPYYFAAVAAIAVLNILYRKLRGSEVSRAHLMSWVALLSTLVVGYAAMGLCINLLKEVFAMPRPYIALSGVQVWEPQPRVKDYQSFPSGHAAFITFMISGLWPKLRMHAWLAWLGVTLAVAVCYSRIALGVHFPADVLGGVLIALTVTLLARRFIYRVLHAPHH